MTAVVSMYVGYYFLLFISHLNVSPNKNKIKKPKVKDKENNNLKYGNGIA